MVASQFFCTQTDKSFRDYSRAIYCNGSAFMANQMKHGEIFDKKTNQSREFDF